MIFNLLLDGETAQQAGPESYLMIVILLVAIVGMFVWSSISNKKETKEAQNMVDSKVGDRVKTIGGVCGFVAEINDKENTFVLRTGLDGKESFVKFDKGAIYQTAPANGNANPEPKEQPKEEKKPAKKVEKKEEKIEEVKAEETAEQPKEEK